MTTLKIKLFSLLFISSTILFSQEYSEFDLNSDGKVDPREFEEVFGDRFHEWDPDANGLLTEIEFHEAVFDRVDSNSDTFLDPNEWNEGFDYIFGDFLGTPHNNQFDVDGDHKISKEEFHGGIKFSDFFSFYDENGNSSIDPKELQNGVFAHWDEDRDHLIDQREYNTFGPYFLTGE